MKNFIHKYTPHPEKLREHKYLSMFGERLHSPSLWHINRRSVAGAFAVGLFCAWVPTPFQMVLAALGAVIFSVNLPVAVALVWITNPLTMAPMFYFSYWLGAQMLGQSAQNIEFELSWHWLSSTLGEIWQPFLLGCFVLGVICSIIGYFSVRGLWRLHLIKKIRERRGQRSK